MPFMGLEIHGLEEIKLDPNMPHTSSMKQKGMRIKVSLLFRARYVILIKKVNGI